MFNPPAPSSEAEAAFARSFAAQMDANAVGIVERAKPVINALTKACEDKHAFARQVVHALVTRMLPCSATSRMGYLYLMDSICKNVRGAFVSEFQVHAGGLWFSTYKHGDAMVRAALLKLLKTWEEMRLFDVSLTQSLRQRIASLPATVPAAPVSVAPAAAPALAPVAPTPVQFPTKATPSVARPAAHPAALPVSSVAPAPAIGTVRPPPAVESFPVKRARVHDVPVSRIPPRLPPRLSDLLGRLETEVTLLPQLRPSFESMKQALFRGGSANELLAAFAMQLRRAKQEPNLASQLDSLLQATTVSMPPGLPAGLPSGLPPGVAQHHVSSSQVSSSQVRPHVDDDDYQIEQADDYQIEEVRTDAGSTVGERPVTLQSLELPRSSVIKALHTLPFQCDTCARRHALRTSAEQCRRRHEYLKRQTDQIEAGDRMRRSRQWFLPQADWQRDDGAGEVFDDAALLGANGKNTPRSSGDSADDDDDEDALLNNGLVLGDDDVVGEVRCALSGDLLERRFHHTTEQWVLKHAVRLPDGRIVHRRFANP